MDKIVLIGGGGHCKVIMDAIKQGNQFFIEGIVDKVLGSGQKVWGIPVIGDDGKLEELYSKGLKRAFIAVGSVGDCSVRKSIYNKLKEIGFILPTIIHPKAIVAESAELGEGTFVAAGAVINPDVKIGKNVIVNTASSVDHDCCIGNFVHIAPGVTLSGTVHVGEATHIGTGTNVVQGVKIGKGCMIKAGVTVKRIVADNKIVGPGIVA